MPAPRAASRGRAASKAPAARTPSNASASSARTSSNSSVQQRGRSSTPAPRGSAIKGRSPSPGAEKKNVTITDEDPQIFATPKVKGADKKVALAPPTPSVSEAVKKIEVRS